MFGIFGNTTNKKAGGKEDNIQMDVNVSVELQQIYKKNHKNYDIALMTLLDSLDQETYKIAFEIINPVSLKGDVTTIKLGNAVIEQIKDTFECKDVSNDLIHLLLWIAVLFPEV